MTPNGGKMTPSPRAPLMAMHLSVECLTIAPTKMSSEEETPPRYGDIYRTECGIHRAPRASKDPRALDPEQDQVHLSQDTHERSMVQVATKVKAFADSHPGVQALREKIKGDYAKNFFSGKPTKDPPIRGPYGEAKIRLRHPHKVVWQRWFALKGDRLEAMKAKLKEFRECGWLEPCTSEWASPAFVVPKKVAGEWRLAVDYRGLNEQTEFDSYTLPLIKDMLQRQHGRRLLTVIDLKHGYHQMPLAPESRACAAMSTPLGPLQWKVMPMGCGNGNASFQRTLEDILKPVADCADPFVDDIIVRPDTEGMTDEEVLAAHEADVRRVLDLLVSLQLTGSANKATIAVNEVEFAGHVGGMGQGQAHSRQDCCGGKLGAPQDSLGDARHPRILQLLHRLCPYVCRNGRPDDSLAERQPR